MARALSKLGFCSRSQARILVKAGRVQINGVTQRDPEKRITNDTAWAERITAPESRLEKTYHVQVDCLADESLIRQMQKGVAAGGDSLAARRVTVLRLGTKNSWLEVVLDEGKNRHIRRWLEALGIKVLRLVRVAIGGLRLGALAKGRWRRLHSAEVAALAGPGRT
ncbi:MAG: rRNA pseudouridine synthase [Verrucomicrobia bacterium]|nr:rRNA pseudouridine synthase [Verrucomicrobiota bacterium]